MTAVETEPCMPSWPDSSSPHTNTAPPSVTNAECHVPADTCARERAMHGAATAMTVVGATRARLHHRVLLEARQLPRHVRSESVAEAEPAESAAAVRVDRTR